MTRNWDVWDKDRVGIYVNTYGEPKNPKPDHLKRMKLMVSLVEGDSILDVGAGCGHLYHQLPKSIDYTGMDSSQPMLDYAKLHAPDAEFMLGDVYDLSPFGTYDTVGAQSLLIHLPEITKPIREMWKHTARVMVFSLPASSQPIVRTYEKYKEKVILSHAEPRSSIATILESLDGFGGYEAINEEESKMMNVYYRVWRKPI